MKNAIAVIGGGISGITTALTLQALGNKTEIYADKIVGGKGDSDPRFASAYPAASVIPHSIKSDRLDELFSKSIRAFEKLYNKNFPAVQLHRHYEVYEFSVDKPEYTSYQKNYAPIHEIDKKLVPRLDADKKLYGWAFDCYVAEFPAYIKQLYKRYKQLGGMIKKRKLHRDRINNLPSDTVVNCAGVWSNKLFDDPAEPIIIRGHMVEVPNRPTVRDERGRICSYNYTPETSIYATPGGDPCDLYFYPVDDKWIMGGSRQTGFLDKDGKWEGKDSEKTITIDDQEIPPQILVLNKAILKNNYGITFPPNSKLKAKVGYRFIRNEGLRLEKTYELEKTVVHNYGHGGAGVTLSWACALEAAKLAAGSDDANLEKVIYGMN